MRIHHLYTDAQGESHFKDIHEDFTGGGAKGKSSARIPVKHLIFRETPADQDSDWHPCPQRQYLVNLDAGVQITASDGEKRHIGPGEVILLEDTTGKGHLSKQLEGKIRHSLFITLE